MIDRLKSALDELALVLEVGDPAACVERAGMIDGGSLSVTVRSTNGPRYFLFDDRGIVEQLPRRDRHLPMARVLEQHDRVLSYRPRRRLVVERVAGERTVVLKGFRRGRSSHAARLHGIATAVGDPRSFRVPQLLAHDIEEEHLTFEKLSGSTLSLDALSPELVHGIGASLAAFQESGQEAVLPLFAHEDELGVLDRWERIVMRIQGRLPDGWAARREEVGVVADGLPNPSWGLCHRDLHDGQFLEMPDGIALLDFDLLCKADVALDPGNLVAHFALRALQGAGIDPSDVLGLTDSLMSGLGRSSGLDFWTTVRFYEATSCLRLALVYAIRPRWAHVVHPLMEVASNRVREIGVLH